MNEKKDNSHIEMDPKSFDVSIKEDIKPESNIYAGIEDEDVTILAWPGEAAEVFLMINTVTLRLKDTDFFKLTKVLQEATKKILLLDE